MSVLCWADLLVEDKDRAAGFYAGLVGWEVGDPGAEMGGYSIMVVNNGAAAGVMPPPPGRDDLPPPCWTAYLNTADIAATTARAVELGGQIHLPPHQVEGRGWFAVIADPSGCVVGLWQPDGFEGFGRWNETGAFAWGEAQTWDATGTRDFLCALLGLEWSAMEGPGEIEYYLVNAPGEPPAFGVLGLGAQVPKDYRGQWKLYLAVDDADAARAQVIALGGDAQGEPFDTPFGRITFVTDSEGAALGLIALADTRPTA